jgi:hypothetical protein
MYVALVSHPDFGPKTSSPIHVGGSRGASFPDLVLSRGGRIRGRVLLNDGTPDARAWISIAANFDQPRLGRAGRYAATDANGRFEFDGLAAGSYETWVTTRDGKSQLDMYWAGQNVTVLEGQVVEKDF